MAPDSIPSKRDMNNGGLFAALIFAVGFLAYYKALGLGYTWDDPSLLRRMNELSQVSPLNFFTNQFFLGTNFYRPLIHLSFWLEKAAGGGPLLSHIINNLLHAFISVACFYLFRPLIKEVPALFGALLFAVHPVHTESIYFVSGRTDLFSSLFVMGLFLSIEAERLGRISPKASRLIGGFSLLLALFSKEVAFLAPLMVGFWLLIVDEGQGERKRVLVWVLLTGTICALFIGFRVFWGDGHLSPFFPVPEKNHWTFSATERLGGIAQYLKLLVLPFPLFAYYTPSMVSLTFTRLLGALVGIGVFAAGFRKEDKWFGLAGLLWLAIFLFPALNIKDAPVPIVAERFLYLPSVGFSLAAGALFGKFSGRIGQKAAFAALCLPLLLFADVTVRRAATWESDINLFTNISDNAIEYPRGHFGYANAQLSIGNFDGAAEGYRRVLRIRANSMEGLLGAAASLLNAGKPEEAGIYIEKIKAEEPDNINLPAFINRYEELMAQRRRPR